MYLLIGKGQRVQNDNIGAKIEKNISKHMSLIAFEFALLCYRCGCEWQTVPVISNPACKTGGISRFDEAV